MTDTKFTPKIWIGLKRLRPETVDHLKKCYKDEVEYIAFYEVVDLLNEEIRKFNAIVTEKDAEIERLNDELGKQDAEITVLNCQVRKARAQAFEDVAWECIRRGKVLTQTKEHSAYSFGSIEQLSYMQIWCKERAQEKE